MNATPQANPSYVPTLFSVVEVIDTTDKVERSFLVNYSDHETKVWLTKTLIWCLTNDKMMTVERATPDDIATKRLFTPRPGETA